MSSAPFWLLPLLSLCSQHRLRSGAERRGEERDTHGGEQKVVRGKNKNFRRSCIRSPPLAQEARGEGGAGERSPSPRRSPLQKPRRRRMGGGAQRETPAQESRGKPAGVLGARSPGAWEAPPGGRRGEPRGARDGDGAAQTFPSPPLLPPRRSRRSPSFSSSSPSRI